MIRLITSIPLLFFISCYAMDPEKNVVRVTAFDDQKSKQTLDIKKKFPNYTQITVLFLHNNKLTDGSITNIHLLSAVTTIILDGNMLTQIPEEICNLPQLKHISLNNNTITVIPDSIKNLTQLTTLRLNRNKKINGELWKLGALTNLEILSLSSCGIRIFPDELCNLTKLRQLDLHNHSIKTLPESIGNIKALKIYYYALKDAFYSLPPSFRTIEHSRRLIHSTPPTIVQLKYIRIKIKRYIDDTFLPILYGRDRKQIGTILQQAAREGICIHGLLAPFLCNERERFLFLEDNAALLKKLIKLAYCRNT